MEISRHRISQSSANNHHGNLNFSPNTIPDPPIPLPLNSVSYPLSCLTSLTSLLPSYFLWSAHFSSLTFALPRKTLFPTCTCLSLVPNEIALSCPTPLLPSLLHPIRPVISLLAYSVRLPEPPSPPRLAMGKCCYDGTSSRNSGGSPSNGNNANITGGNVWRTRPTRTTRLPPGYCRLAYDVAPGN